MPAEWQLIQKNILEYIRIYSSGLVVILQAFLGAPSILHFLFIHKDIEKLPYIVASPIDTTSLLDFRPPHSMSGMKLFFSMSCRGRILCTTSKQDIERKIWRDLSTIINAYYFQSHIIIHINI